MIGYQEADVEYHDAREINVLRRLLANDPAIAALDLQFEPTTEEKEGDNEEMMVGEDDWGTVTGIAIARSSHLRKLIVSTEYTQTLLVSNSFLKLVAANRSIEDLRLDCIFLKFKTDSSSIIAPFFEHNHNLRSVRLFGSYFSKRLPSLPMLLQYKTIRLERIDLSICDLSDEYAASIVDALSAIPGLCHLLDLFLSYNKIESTGCNALSSLLKNPACRMQRMDLAKNNIDDKSMGILVSGLMENRSLKVLDLKKLKLITPNGWRTFSPCLSIPSCSVETIDLSDNNIGDDGAIALGDAMTVNKSLTSLDLSSCASITSAGWGGLFSGVDSTAIEVVKLCKTNVTDEGALSIVSALAQNRCFKSLHLSDRSITSAGWIKCFHSLSDSEITWESLHLCDNNIDDEGAVMLMGLLAANVSIEHVDLGKSDLITSDGWIQCFQLMSDLKVSLDALHLDANEIDSEGADALVEWLTENDSVSTLSIQGHRDSISLKRWLAFARLLHPTSSSKLNVLRLGAGNYGSSNNDDYMIAFAEALAGNTTLEILELFDCCTDDDDYDDDAYFFLDLYNPKISKRGWDAFANALCDSSSITSICTSNHTLHEVWEFHWESGEVVPSEINALLSINGKKNKAEVVRTKIITHYFSEADNIDRTFMDFATSIMPDAIGWIGRDYLGYSTMYRLLQSMPWLLESNSIIPEATVALEPPTKLRKVE